MKSLILIGAALVLLGILGFAIPVFTTSQTKDVAKVGDLKVQANEQSTHVVPESLSGGAIVLGGVLILAGLLKR